MPVHNRFQRQSRKLNENEAQTFPLPTAAGCALPIVTPSLREQRKSASPTAFELDELSVTELQRALQSGKYTSRSLVEKYVDRITEIDKDGPRLNSVIEINPDAEQIAVALDRERKEKGARGPLHGIPILIKDNIDTATE